MKSPSHFPDLLNQVLEAFADKSLHTFLDGTLGAGGHAKGLLETHPEIQLYIGMDQDSSALELAKKNLAAWHQKTYFLHSNFSKMKKELLNINIDKVDGILLDLGVSSMQLDQPEKGFSFMREGPLDMRMDSTQSLTAAEIVNTWPEQELGKIFRDFGEERQWRAAARAIVKAREHQVFSTTKQLADSLYPILSRHKKPGIHPLTLVFQGLRIAVNNELAVIEKTLPDAIQLLSPGGRLAVISFHSLEDRLVKDAFRYAASNKEDTAGLGGGLFISKSPSVIPISRKPVTAESEEVAINPRSRSAKLRIVEKLEPK
jgi:16S rRNA (cytosine1402-N4)-methyltransferase